jgi:hypothetical protein
MQMHEMFAEHRNRQVVRNQATRIVQRANLLAERRFLRHILAKEIAGGDVRQPQARRDDLCLRPLSDALWAEEEDIRIFARSRAAHRIKPS